MLPDDAPAGPPYRIEDTYLELLGSTMAHDLLSPVGAVASGLEFMAEMGPGEESLSLITRAAEAASAKLQLLRMAWGGAGVSADVGPAQVRERLGAYLAAEGGRIQQDWAPQDVAGAFVPPRAGLGKAFLLALMVGAGCLPRGGVLRARVQEGRHRVLIEAAGERAALRDHIAEALALRTPVDALPPDAAAAAIAGLLLRRHGFALSPRAFLEGRVTLSLHPTGEGDM
jgi:histidine phosphotransferase ChpT